MKTKNIYIYIYTTFLILISILLYHIFSRKSINSRQQAINYPATTTQAITAIDTGGNLSSLSFPSGFILIWYPPDSTYNTLALVASSVPLGWAMCDGTKGTPDLRGRFVLMAQDTIPLVNVPPGATTHSIGQTGGREKHALTEAEMPAHNHEIELHISGSGGSERVAREYGEGRQGTTYAGMRGGSQPHEIMPPFYTLVYVMKL